jgi:hypothetical protein
VRKAQISRVPKFQNVEVIKCRYLSGSSDSKGSMAPDLRNRDFVTHRFYHGAQRSFAKHEITKHPGVGPMVIAQYCMERWKELCQRPRAPTLITKKYMHGFETLGLTRRKHEDHLEHSWV